MEYNPQSQAIQNARRAYKDVLLQQSAVLAFGNPLTLAALSLITTIERLSVGNYTTQSEAENACQIKKPSLLLVHESLEQGSGLGLIASVKQLSPDTRCLLFLERETQPVVRDAINAHTDGVMFVSSIGGGLQGDFVQALASVAEGNTYYPKEVRERAGFDMKPLPDLSVKELETLRALCLGLSNKDIAATLVVSTETVKSHVSSLITKFGVADRTAVVIAAIRAGL